MSNSTRGALPSLAAMGVFALGSWLLQLAWFLFRLFIAAVIAWGLIGSLERFPYEEVASWQTLISSETLDFPGADVFLWCARGWFEIAVLVLLLNSMRARRVLAGVGPTSHHAAFAASALANYLSVNPTTPRLLGIERSSGSWNFWKLMLAEAIYGRIFRIFAGVPFLPDEAIPERDGRPVKLQEDLKEFATLYQNHERGSRPREGEEG